MNTVIQLFETAARADRAAIIVARVGLVVVLVWIGGLKAFAYEDEGIVPFVANSPLMPAHELLLQGTRRGVPAAYEPGRRTRAG
jgi:uncharacterized membrane protein YkgB